MKLKQDIDKQTPVPKQKVTEYEKFYNSNNESGKYNFNLILFHRTMFKGSTKNINNSPTKNHIRSLSCQEIESEINAEQMRNSTRSIRVNSYMRSDSMKMITQPDREIKEEKYDQSQKIQKKDYSSITSCESIRESKKFKTNPHHYFTGSRGFYA